MLGSRVLEVRGRSSGEPRRTPVNLLELEGERYLVAPRGETQWVRNLRASGEGRLLVGTRGEPFTAVELTDEAEAADAARLPEALEGRGRSVLRRGRTGFLGRGAARRRARSIRCSGLLAALSERTALTAPANSPIPPSG